MQALLKYIAAVLFFLLSFPLFSQPPQLSNYNIKWTTQSKNSSESMPLGGGDIGLNVWVEEGDILFYLSRSGTFDENNQMLKLGRVRLKLSSSPFNNNNFSQELRVSDGGIVIKGKDTEVHLWVDVFSPIVHLEIKTASARNVQVVYESWRAKDHLVTGTEFRANSYKVQQKFDVVTAGDSIRFEKNRVLFYHRPNAGIPDVFDHTVHTEQMDTVKDQLFNPLKNNTFGGVMIGDGMIAKGTIEGKYADTDYTGWVLQTSKPVRHQEVKIALHVEQASSAAEWISHLEEIVTRSASNKTALQKTRDWWHGFWNRSYLFIDGKDSVLSRNYQLFRYQLGCNAYGKWPTKFNGGLFTFDPSFIDKRYNYSPDFRLWGGGTMTAQNQRLVYYSMLKSGDFDMMIPQFDFYLNALRNAELRSEVYWHHKGACFTEQIEQFGLPNLTEYGGNRPEGFDAGLEFNPWLEYLWETVFEFCQMILETERYADKDITRYIPLIESCLTFYDEHYQYLTKKLGARPFDQNGQYIFYPTSSAETYKMAYNSTTVICALKIILERVLELPANYLDDVKRKKWSAMLQRIPPIPLKEVNGRKMLAPADQWSWIQNTETPQLYPVYPWGIYGVGKPDVDVAINTYKLDTQAVKYRSHIGWRQYSIWAARLGMTQEAVTLTREKLSDGPHRFPTFWGPAFDWTPDHNWGGSAMIGMQEMLMQVDGRKIYLLPAWPTEWDARFKLHAPYNTTVEGSVKGGKIVELTVTPASRKADIVFPK